MASSMFSLSSLDEDEDLYLQIDEESTRNLLNQVSVVEGLTLSWSKSMEYLPVFTINEIEKHRQLTGKVIGKRFTDNQDISERQETHARWLSKNKRNVCLFVEGIL